MRASIAVAPPSWRPWVGKGKVDKASLTQVLFEPLFSWNEATNGPSAFKPTEVSLASYNPTPPTLPTWASLPPLRVKH